MLKKLSLDRTKKYEISIATYEIVEMLVAFVEGRKHIQCIGAEQGDIKGWDDFIIQNSEDSYVHIQVKRQQTPFSPRGSKSVKDDTKKGTERQLSPLDNALKDLAEWVQNPTKTGERLFRIELPSSGVKIKDDLEVREFISFLDNIKSTTTVKGLENLITTQKDKTAISVNNWLATWCGFTDLSHVLNGLGKLRISDSGLEGDLDKRSIENLNRVFSSSDKVLGLIKSYVENESAYTGSIAPRQLLFQLKKFLLPSMSTWTQIDYDGENYNISGIHDLEDNNCIERPSVFVPLVLSNDRSRFLKVNIQEIDHTSPKPVEEVFQLAMHLKGNCNTHCLNKAGWIEFLKGRTGGTLGKGEDDFDNLSIHENTDVTEIIEFDPINTRTKREEFATEIRSAIIKETWELVKRRVNSKVNDMNSSELSNAAEIRWNNWKDALDNDFGNLGEIFKNMLQPEIEKISGNLRVGIKTKDLLAEGIFFLLIITVVLNEDDQGLDTVLEGMTINTISLHYWSGPVGSNKKVRKIDDEEVTLPLIENERAEILLIPNSNQPENQLYQQTLASIDHSDITLAAPIVPKLIITKDAIINKYIRQGEIKPFNEYLMGLINSKIQTTQNAINNIVR